jgi:hypothetical protein
MGGAMTGIYVAVPGQILGELSVLPGIAQGMAFARSNRVSARG